MIFHEEEGLLKWLHWRIGLDIHYTKSINTAGQQNQFLIQKLH
jgi:hypothetical protein